MTQNCAPLQCTVWPRNVIFLTNTQKLFRYCDFSDAIIFKKNCSHFGTTKKNLAQHMLTKLAKNMQKKSAAYLPSFKKYFACELKSKVVHKLTSSGFNSAFFNQTVVPRVLTNIAKGTPPPLGSRS